MTVSCFRLLGLSVRLGCQPSLADSLRFRILQLEYIAFGLSFLLLTSERRAMHEAAFFV